MRWNIFRAGRSQPGELGLVAFLFAQRPIERALDDVLDFVSQERHAFHLRHRLNVNQERAAQQQRQLAEVHLRQYTFG